MTTNSSILSDDCTFVDTDTDDDDEVNNVHRNVEKLILQAWPENKLPVRLKKHEKMKLRHCGLAIPCNVSQQSDSILEDIKAKEKFILKKCSINITDTYLSYVLSDKYQPKVVLTDVLQSNFPLSTRCRNDHKFLFSNSNPVSTKRRFNVDSTSGDVETTSNAYWKERQYEF